jgi:glycosyltransferase involved in cell wall biosynthesis
VTFVGPVALDATDEDLLTGAGAVLLGPREHAAVPAYLTGADVLLVPHVVTDFTESLAPSKLYEYLAAARPIVSTPVAGFREIAGAAVRVVARDGFVAAVRDALTDDAPLTGVAAVPTWDERAVAMHAVVQELHAPRA